MTLTSLPLIVSLATLALVGASPLLADPPKDWTLTFSDEFAGDTLDPAKWGTTMAFMGTHGPRYHNEYYSSYTVDDDVIVADGSLRLRTDRRTVAGRNEKPGTFHFTQGLVSTHDKFAFTHGYIEIRARFPVGKGLWPCFWLMAQHQTWPPEFDVAEYYGGQRKMHFGLAHGTLDDIRWDSSGDTNMEAVCDWHTYALEWMPGRAVWSVDGIPRKTIKAEYVPSTPMYVVLSNSVSSALGPSGAPDADTVFPNYFEIDYVRVYKAPAAGAVEAVLARNDSPAKEAPAVEPIAAPPVTAPAPMP
jgi:beta-glucanase (GH16 family)